MEKIGKPDEEQRERERLFFCVSIIVDPQCHVTTVVLLQLAPRNVERERVVDKLRLRTRQDTSSGIHGISILDSKFYPNLPYKQFFEVTTLFGLMIRLASHKFV